MQLVGEGGGAAAARGQIQLTQRGAWTEGGRIRKAELWHAKGGAAQLVRTKLTSHLTSIAPGVCFAGKHGVVRPPPVEGGLGMRASHCQHNDLPIRGAFGFWHSTRFPLGASNRSAHKFKWHRLKTLKPPYAQVATCILPSQLPAHSHVGATRQ